MNNVTPEMLSRALMYLNSAQVPIKKIKVTSEFADYLEKICPSICLDTFRGDGIRATFTSIPIVVDDEIKNEFYELVY